MMGHGFSMKLLFPNLKSVQELSDLEDGSLGLVIYTINAFTPKQVNALQDILDSKQNQLKWVVYACQKHKESIQDAKTVNYTGTNKLCSMVNCQEKAICVGWI